MRCTQFDICVSVCHLDWALCGFDYLSICIRMRFLTFGIKFILRPLTFLGISTLFASSIRKTLNFHRRCRRCQQHESDTHNKILIALLNLRSICSRFGFRFCTLLGHRHTLLCARFSLCSLRFLLYSCFCSLLFAILFLLIHVYVSKEQCENIVITLFQFWPLFFVTKRTLTSIMSLCVRCAWLCVTKERWAEIKFNISETAIVFS